MSVNCKKYSLILADAHVHIYDCFDVEQLLDSALKNFQNNARKQSKNDDFAGILLLTESRGDNYFQNFLATGEISGHRNKWSFQTTQESISLIARNQHNQELILIAGRQIVTLEKLEVSALFTEKNIEDSLSLEATIKAIIADGGIPVLPWGFGKWIGKRGKLISDLLANNTNNKLANLCLGDNGGRPWFWRQPAYFTQAQQQNLRILPGTDPLPIADQFYRPGSFGFMIKADLSPEQPGKELKKMLIDPTIILQNYGNLESSWRFLRNQLALRN